MDLRADGTIVIPFPRTDNPGTTQDVTLRRITLDELYDRWEALDQIAGEERAALDAEAEAEAAAVSPAANGAAVDAAGGRRQSIKGLLVGMRLGAVWMRDTVHMLGAPSPYTSGADGALVLQEGLQEPAWFANQGIKGQMLSHWQQVPLVPGNVPTPA